jgi:hypothetical protein
MMSKTEESVYFNRLVEIEYDIDELIGTNGDEPRVMPLDTRRVAVRIDVLEDILNAALDREAE